MLYHVFSHSIDYKKKLDFFMANDRSNSLFVTISSSLYQQLPLIIAIEKNLFNLDHVLRGNSMMRGSVWYRSVASFQTDAIFLAIIKTFPDIGNMDEWYRNIKDDIIFRYLSSSSYPSNRKTISFLVNLEDICKYIHLSYIKEFSS